MRKTILNLFTLTTLFIATPIALIASPLIEIMEMTEPDGQGITLQVIDNELCVSGAAGQVLRIYNVTGVCVFTAKVDSDSKRYTLDMQRGCYIVKVGKVVRKISLK